jgi:hypothetical protein
LFNVPETDTGTIEERAAVEKENFKQILESIKTDITIIELRRIGKKSPEHYRPLIVKCTDMDGKTLV